MHDFTVNSTCPDAYKNFKFRIKWEGRYVAGVSRVSALSRTTEVIFHDNGTYPGTGSKFPGQTTFEPVTLEGGVTHDEEFAAWASNIETFEDGSAPCDFRKDIILEFSNDAGQPVLAYKIFGCWVSEYSALPGLDVRANAVALELITLENEGWERDTSILEYDASSPARRSQSVHS